MGKYPSTNYIVTDRHGKIEILAGQRLRIKHCIGRYGQTATHEGVAEQIDEWRGVRLRLDDGKIEYIPLPTDLVQSHDKDIFKKWPDGRTLLQGYRKHEDFEHGHEKWVEVIEEESEFAGIADYLDEEKLDGAN